MLAAESVHKPFCGLDRTFRGLSGAVQRDVNDVTKSGQYYVTPEMCRELKHINNGIDHIRLDQDFLRTSRDWGNKWSPDTINRDKQGAIRSMEHATSTMQNIKGGLSTQRVQTLQENQVRASHGASVAQLKNVETDMGPYAHQSVDRIKQFCDHVGVTDRYTGYRNNLTRGRQDPRRLAASWQDNTTRNPYNASLNVGWKPGSTVPARQYQDWRQTTAPAALAPRESKQAVSTPEPASRKSIQEQCGINTKFPGHTEYMDRFIRPPTNQSTPGYIINPIPNYRMNERELGHPAFHRSRTEYQSRFEYPDGNKLARLPWLRQ